MNATEPYTLPELVIIAEEPHPLEEIIQGAVDDNDNKQIMGIFTELYKRGRIDEIEYILQRQLFTPGMISTALETIAAAANPEPDKTNNI